MKMYMANWNKRSIPGRRWPATIAFLLLLLAGVQAQEVTTDTPKDSLPEQFDATDRAFIKRYRYPDAVPFDRKDRKSHTYISVFGGIDKILPRSYTSFNVGPTGGVAVGTQLSAAHGLRLSLYGGTLTRSDDNASLTRFGTQADYLFNVTSYTSGYNPGRFFEFSLLAGLGYQYSTFEGNREHVGELHAGLQLKLHPSPQLDIFLEPRLGLATDGIDHSFQQNWHKYDLTYGAVIGLNYRLKRWTPIGRRSRALQEENFLDNTFISYATGAQMQLSRLTGEIGRLRSVGPHVTVSAGKWIAPLLALRLSAFYSGDTWHRKIIQESEDTEAYEIYEMSSYMGGRLEGMFNLLRLISKEADESPWGLNLLLGGELGYMWKESYLSPTRGGYMGLTGGIQAKYQVAENTAIFLEPRFTLASYSALTRNSNGQETSERYADNLFSLNIGIELQRASHETRLARSLNRELFERSFFVSASGGMQALAQGRRYNLKHTVSPSALLAVGYRFSPLSSVRLAGEYSQIRENRQNGDFKHRLIGGSLIYMLNLTNLMTGYEPERKWNVHLLAGLAGTACLRNDGNENKFTIGEEVGVQASYQVYKRFHIFLEPKTHFYPKEKLMQWNKQGTDVLMSLQAGVTYDF